MNRGLKDLVGLPDLPPHLFVAGFDPMNRGLKAKLTSRPVTPHVMLQDLTR